ncbi:Ig-like domain repeat protein [uncultured Methanobrevibacter sp.]|uniref:Ig-like domain repeat protein n=1 Tax=uncultured Methanobrevibacter sp. TaxID=253161 RepID=UPI00263454E0|nr:Ig-like domain repeat protein [uncultured Methanobrevibacter sp.]
MLSVVSASDLAGNDTISAANDGLNTISVTNDQGEILGNPAGNFKNLDKLINDTANDGTASFEGDYAYSSGDEGLSQGILIDKNITVDGNGFTVNASNAASIFEIGAHSSVVLQNINFVNANGNTYGAIKVDSTSTVEIINCNFINNNATSGAAIYLLDSSSASSTLKITGSNFINNTASFGGAIYLNESASHSSTIENSKFINCTSTVSGGACYISADRVTFKKATFENNTAYQNGGALYWEGHIGVINDSIFRFNRAKGYLNSSATVDYTNPNTGIDEVHYDILGGDGGAIEWKGSEATIENTTFYKNTASYRGGSIFFTNLGDENCENITIKSSNFTENYAGLNGGALDWSKGANNATILKSDFIKNTAGRSAGAIYVSGNNLDIEDTVFNYNKVTGENKYDNRTNVSNYTSIGGNGGAICWMGSFGTVDNVTFLNNTATQRGGAIQFERNQNGTVKNSKFENNSAYSDGGAIDWYHGAVNGQLINTTFKNNNILGDGRGAGVYIEGHDTTIRDSRFYRHDITCDGVVYIQGNKSTIKNTTFEDITTTKNGGAIYVLGDDANISTCSFDTCKAYSGGAIYIAGNNAIINYTNMINNYCTEDGGALYVNGTGVKLYNTRLINNTAGDDGGAVNWRGNDGTIYNITCINNKGISINKPNGETSSSRGGTIAITGSNITLSESSFKSSSVWMESSKKPTKVDGGALFITGNNVNITGTTFDDCNATNGGGAIYIIGNVTDVVGCTFSNTHAVNGGTIYVVGLDADIQHSDFEKTSATEKGGSIFIEGDRVTILNSTISTSNAENGGAVYVAGDDAEINESSFDNCIATKMGGIMFIVGEGTTIASSVLSNSSSSESGGAIYVNGNNAAIVGSDFENIKSNKANGGAIYVAGSFTDIDHSSFFNCTTSQNGGAIYIEDVGTTISYSNFTKCSANTAGAISINGENTTIEHSVLDHNTAKTSAGAIHVLGKNVLLIYNNFTYNSASIEGGALNIGGQNASVYYSWFDNNGGVQNGGAINWLGGHGDDSIVGSRFTNNKCIGGSRGGGAIYWAASTGTITSGGLIKDTVFINNSATAKHGGAINWYHAVDSKFDNCTFINNTASSDGGAIYSGHQNGGGKNLTITNSRFYNNHANKHGGAIANQMSSSVIYNCTFDNNYANHGGGTIVMKEDSGDNSIIDNCRFYNSDVLLGASTWDDGCGGAISIGKTDTNITISNSVFINTTTHERYGGAVSIRGADSSMINVTIINSSALNDNGGAIYWFGQRGTLDNVNITNSSVKSKNNARDISGGAIYWVGSDGSINDLTIINSSSINNFTTGGNKQVSGGAISIAAENTILTNVEIINSSVYSSKGYGRGGSIFWSTANARLENISITNSSTFGYQGGAIHIGGGGASANNINITNSSLIATANFDVAGGAIYWYSDNSNLNNVSISNSTVEYHFPSGSKSVYGGAIYITGSNVKLTNADIDNSSLIADNGAGFGGAIYRVTSTSNDNLINVSINNSYVYGTAGGAISWHAGNANVENISIINSSVKAAINKNAEGGAIYWTAANSNLTNIYISNSSANYNYASGSNGVHGGAIFVNNVNNKLVNVNIDNSSAIADNGIGNGGAIYWSGSNGKLYNASINNSYLYANSGGAIYWSGSSGSLNDVSIINSSLESTENKDALGGAIYLSGQYCQLNDLSVCNSSVNYSYANGDKRADGGAVYISNSNAWLTNVTIDNSSAFADNGNAHGGSIYWGGNYGNLLNASISNTLANGQGGAIYWSGGNSPVIRNITIINSSTQVKDSIYTANGGAIYSNNVPDLRDILIINSSATDNKEVKGGAIYWTGTNLYNVTVINSTAKGSGDSSYGGAVYWGSQNNRYIYNSTFINATAGYGGAVYKENGVLLVYNTKFINNTATVDGGAVYAKGAVASFYNSTFKNNSAKEHGGAIYYYNHPNSRSTIKDTYIINNTAFQGSGIYATILRCNLENVVLLDNQAHSNKFINQKIGEEGTGKYISAVFVGYDNLLNGIWDDNPVVKNKYYAFTNVTYWGVNGRTVTGREESPNRNDNETRINITIDIYDNNGKFIKSEVVETDSNGMFRYDFNAADESIASFRFYHLEDRYYTNLSDTLSNRSIVKIFVDNIFDGENATVNLNLTDGAWKRMSGDVTVTFNDTRHTTIVIKVINGTGYCDNVSGLEAGTYNATANFPGDATHSGDTDWCIFRVRPIVDLVISKTLDTQKELLNVSDTVKYTITVKNTGLSKSNDVNVTEKLSEHLSLTKATPTRGEYNEKGGYWYIGTLRGGETVTLTIEAKVISAGLISNKVNVSGSEDETNYTNNNASAKNITALPIVDVKVTKKVNITTSSVNVTDKIKFTITVHNNGPCDASDVYVNETLSSHLKFESATVTPGYGSYNRDTGIWYIGNLANQSTAELIIIAKVISNGTIANAVNVTSHENDTNLTNNKDKIKNITALNIVDLTINKNVNAGSYVNVTDTITYTITVHNNGPSDATGVYVNESLSSHLTLISSQVTPGYGQYDAGKGIWHIGDMKNGSKAVLTIVAKVKSNGTIVNAVSVNSTENDTNKSNNRDSVTITALPIVDLSIVKVSNVTGKANVTDKIKFTITVHNNGPSDATHVNVSEVLSKHLELDTYTITPGYGTYNKTTGVWSIGTMQNQSTAVLTIFAKVKSNGTIANAVTIASYENDTNKSNNNYTIKNITALPIVDLLVTKKVNVTTKTLNLTDKLTFTVTVTNKGPCNATNVNVSDVLDSSLKLLDYTATKGDYDGKVWSGIGTLNVGVTETLTIYAQVEFSGEIDNEAIAYSYENDTNLTNNRANVSTILVTTEVDLAVSKMVDNKGPVNVSDQLTFTIVVRNISPNPASGVYVIEKLDSHLKLISADGDYNVTSGIWYIGNLPGRTSAYLTIVAEVITPGNISNAVHVTGFDNDTNLNNNNASIDNITALPIVDMIVKKTVDVEGGYVNVTDIIVYTITVTNAGPCNATNVNVSEPLSSKLKILSNTTNAGYYDADKKVWYIGNMTNHTTVNLTIRAQVISIGTIDNVVIVNSTENDTNKSNNRDKVTIISLPIVDLNITKKSNLTGNVNVTNRIEFTITVKNNGPWDASNVNVSEVLSSNLKLISNNTNAGYYNKTAGIWHIGNLANQSSAKLTLVVEVTDEGIIDNFVNVTSTENDTNLTNNHDEVILQAFYIVDVRVAKTDNASSRDVEVTEKIKFTITVTNAGPCNATGVYVDEGIDSALTILSNTTTKGNYTNGRWYVGNLSVGETQTLEIFTRVDYSGIINNVVVAHSNENDTNLTNNRANITALNSTAHVDLAISKMVNVSGSINVTDQILFTITVKNNGPCNASGVYVIEKLDSHLREVSHSATNGTYNGTVWNIGYLNSDESAVLTIIAEAISKGIVSNVVVVGGFDDDKNQSNNNASIKNITVLPIVDLEITKTVNTGDKVNVTDAITYTITVKNNGPCEATNVNVSEVISSLLNVTGISTSCGKYNESEDIWHIGTMANQSSAVLYIYATVLKNGTIENVVTVSSYENDTNPDNNRANITIEAFPIVDVSITKTVNVSGDVEVTDIIKFTVTVHNDGPCNATNVYVKEALDPALRIIDINITKGVYKDNYTWVIGNMSVGETQTLELITRVAYSGYIVNDVIVYCNENDTDMSNNYDGIGTITSSANVDLTINKTVNTTGPVNVTDFIEFTITVHNNGPCNASGVYVGEALDSLMEIESVKRIDKGTYDGFTWVIGYLDFNETVTLTIVAKVIAAGNITNVATVSGFDNDTNTSNNNASIDNVTALPIVDLQVTKIAELEGDAVNVNDIIQYTVSVRNNGPCDATDVRITEVLSPHLEMITYLTWMGYYDVNEGVWHIGDLPSGYYVDLIIQAQVISNGTISNVAIAHSNENDTNKSNNRADAKNITARPVVDLEIFKEVNVTEGYVNITDQIRYTVTVSNYGPSNATKVSVSEKLSSGLRFINYTADRGDYDEIAGIWYIGNLNRGSTAVLTIDAKVIGDGIIENNVVVYSYENDTNPYNNHAEVAFESIALVDLSVSKTSNVSGNVNVTDIIEFTITAHNDGPSNATGVYVEEILSSSLKLIKYNATIGDYDGFTWNIGRLNANTTATLTIVAEIIAEGIIDNEAFITGMEFDTNESNNYDNISSLNATAYVDLSITKTTNATEIVSVTDLIEFTVKVSNAGPCNATNVLVSEGLDYHLELVSYNATVGTYDGYTWVIGTLNRGANATLTIVARVISTGNISNTVTVTSSEKDTNESNSHANITNLTAYAFVDVSITKETNATPIVSVTDIIEFTVKVSNAGPCNATNVLVSEGLDYHLSLVSYNATVGTYDGYTWVIGNLESGANATLTIVAEVISTGIISNEVTVTYSENDTNTSNDHANITNLTAYAFVDVSITKETNATPIVSVNDIIEFTIKVSNAGPCNATNVLVSEGLSYYLSMISYNATVGTYDGYTWVIGNLNRNSTATLTIVAKVISEGNITNEVTVTCSENDTNTSNDHANITNITALKITDLQITKSSNVSGYVDMYDIIEFTITVHNIGPCDATGVNVSEVLDSHLKLKSYDATLGDYDGRVWTIGDMESNTYAYLTIIAEVIAYGDISNAVNVTGNEYDNDTSGNHANVTNITALPSVDLKVTKTSNVSGVINVTDRIRFTVTVTNNGPCDATDVNVSEVLNSNLKLINYIATVGSYDGKMWNIGILNDKSSATLTIFAEVISAGIITNDVNVTSNEYDTNKSNNNASIDNITSVSITDLKITKIANATLVNVSDLVEFTIEVVNNGPCDAAGVNVSEVLESNLKLIDYKASAGSYDGKVWNIGKMVNQSKATLKIIAQVIGDGTVSNSANVTYDGIDTNKSNNRASSDNITSLPVVDVKVIKTANVTEAKFNEIISYTIVVENDGPSDATEVIVTEHLSNSVGFVKYGASQGSYDVAANIWYVGRLANGTSATLTLTVQITRIGVVENSVDAASKENDTNLTNNRYVSEDVVVENYYTSLDLNTYDITYGEDEILTVKLPTKATGAVNITVGNRTYDNVPIRNGMVELQVSDLGAGSYDVHVAYGGDGKFLPNSTDGKFGVARATPIITIEVEDIWVWEIEVLNVTVNAPGSVFVTVNGITVEIPLENGTVTTDVLAAAANGAYKGNATWKIINLPVGTYPAYARYPGNENFTSAETSDVFHVRDLIQTNVAVNVDDIYVGEDAVVHVIVGPRGVSGNVTVNVDGKNYTVPLEDGEATVTISGLIAGDQNVTVWYNGNMYYLPSENATSFNVLKMTPPIDVDAFDVTYGKDGVIIVTVPDDATGYITIEIEGKRFTSKIKDGQAVFVIPGLKEGKHNIKVFYSGDDKYLPTNTTGTIKVTPKGDHKNESEHGQFFKVEVPNTMYATGNPIGMLVVVIMSLCCIYARRFRR